MILEYGGKEICRSPIMQKRKGEDDREKGKKGEKVEEENEMRKANEIRSKK
jgi:hypothetical protein